MATATKSRSTRKSADAPFGFKKDGTARKRPVPTAAIAAKKAAAAKPAAKVAVKPAKAKPAVETPEPAKGSVSGTFDLARMPKGDGGVRFEERPLKDGSVRGFSPQYVNQDHFAELDSPESIRVVFTAL